jgi:hypothetical protein
MCQWPHMAQVSHYGAAHNGTGVVFAGHSHSAQSRFQAHLLTHLMVLCSEKMSSRIFSHKL